LLGSWWPSSTAAQKNEVFRVTLFRVVEDWTSPEGKKEDGFDIRQQDSSSPHFTSTESSSVEGVNTWVIGRIGFSKIFYDQVAKNDAATAAANQEALLSVDQGVDEEEEEDGVGGRTLSSPVLLLLRRRRRQRVRPRPRCRPLLRRHMVPALRGSLAVH
jgi:hypothetical protein